jgi:cytochrome c peroxidase
MLFRILWFTSVCGLLMAAVEINRNALKTFGPLPAEMTSAANPITEAKVQLGRVLYYEPRLSRSQDVSCNSCHALDAYGIDPEPVSTGFKGRKGNRNAPTVYNAAGHIAQFWDGRAPDVEQQAKGPVMNPVEMAMPSEKTAVAVLASMPEYVAMFQRAFPGQADPVTFDNMAIAIGAFERRLVTPSRWDAFLKGTEGALTDAEKAGFNKFVETGCTMCHNGVYVGGNSYQKLGLVEPWPRNADPGRFAVTKNAADRMVFKVPSLRNIDRTAPYFHDGSVAKLPQAIAMMAQYQTGRTLKPAEVESIAAWLRSLTGEIPANYVRQPVLPKSTAATPAPDRS